MGRIIRIKKYTKKLFKNSILKYKTVYKVNIIKINNDDKFSLADLSSYQIRRLQMLFCKRLLNNIYTIYTTTYITEDFILDNPTTVYTKEFIFLKRKRKK